MPANGVGDGVAVGLGAALGGAGVKVGVGVSLGGTGVKVGVGGGTGECVMVGAGDAVGAGVAVGVKDGRGVTKAGCASPRGGCALGVTNAEMGWRDWGLNRYKPANPARQQATISSGMMYLKRRPLKKESTPEAGGALVFSMGFVGGRDSSQAGGGADAVGSFRGGGEGGE